MQLNGWSVLNYLSDESYSKERCFLAEGSTDLNINQSHRDHKKILIYIVVGFLLEFFDRSISLSRSGPRIVLIECEGCELARKEFSGLI